ncbi:hypothetical protein FACS189459_1060 [Bacilli bacterium]|nr:hypothetical protein FACS189459_1060 [Bacilli bacterium]
MKHILHIDMDAFFASVEAAKNPSIKNKPFIVTWIGKHSVVSSGNYLARSYGVKSGMPVYMAQLLCKNLLLVPLDFESYKEYHTKFIEIIKQKITRKIEVASIDECYVDISDNIKTKNEAMRLAYRIQKLIEEGLNITCSIGVSNNKFLAKMGSDFKKPNGLTKLYTTDVEKKLWPLPVKKMYMVGESSSALLEQNRIFTIGDIIKEQNETIIKEIFGSNTN